MNIDQAAEERIKELEAQLEDAYVIIDLQQADLDEYMAENRALKAQNRALRNHQKVNYGVS